MSLGLSAPTCWGPWISCISGSSGSFFSSRPSASRSIARIDTCIHTSDVATIRNSSMKQLCQTPVRSLRMPNWSLSIQSHILAETIVGIAQGTRMAARTKPRNLNSALSTSATIRPSRVSMETAITVK